VKKKLLIKTEVFYPEKQLHTMLAEKLTHDSPITCCPQLGSADRENLSGARLFISNHSQ
jgi:hypothetical protein